MELHGLLIVDKPRGVTSHDVVARVRRLLGMKRVGHAGTLDPAAEGVLVVGVGRATKLLDAVQGTRKTYLARVALGAESISGDSEGPLKDVRPVPPLPTSEIERVLAGFRGEIEQVPPGHSAVKIGGQPAYRRARRGDAVEIPPRRVTIHHLTLLAHREAEIDLQVECSAGTYIRSLAQDIGAALGVGGYLQGLLRTRSGAFGLADAWTLAELDHLLSPASFASLALHPASALPGASVLVLDREQRNAWYDGRPVPASGSADATAALAFDRDGLWVGVARGFEPASAWQPRLVVGRGEVEPHVVAIGNFDGVHRGHQHILRLVAADARRNGARSAVVTFDPLPPEVLRPSAAPARLTSTPERLALIAAQGIDDIEVLPFTPELSQQSPGEFVDLLVARLSPIEVVVGADFRFGHQRAGTVDTLRTIGQERGFEVRAVDRVGDDQGDVSSSRIRALIATGDVRDAWELLGRPYRLSGFVVQGFQRGRTLGFPTANLTLDPRLAIPADGIYAGWARIPGDSTFPAMIYIGSRPTFADGSRVVEVHVLDFSGDLYGAELTVAFACRIRGDIGFTDVSELVRQMERDRDAARAALAAFPPALADQPAEHPQARQGVRGGHG